MDHYLPLLPLEYRERLKRFKRWQDAQLTLLGRLLLIDGFKKFGYQLDQFEISYTSFNKPFVDEKLHFNISHSGKIAICAITNVGEIGIDIEKITLIDPHDFKINMSHYEWNRVNNSVQPVPEFFEYWTEKESVLKASGEGLSLPLNSFVVHNNFTQILNKPFFTKKLSICHNYCCHIALNTENEFPTIDINKKKY